MDRLLASLPQQLLNGVFAGSIYALFALGYTLVFGVLDILNLAHAAIFMMGAMVSWWLVSEQGWSLFLAFPVAVVLVEQNSQKALQIADYAYVLDRGLIVPSCTWR